MFKKLKVLALTGYLTSYLPSTQKDWKVLSPSDLGCNIKELERILKSGEPFMCHGKVSKTVNYGDTILTSSIRIEEGVYYFTLSGEYLSVDKSEITPISAIFSYDPRLRILKGRRP